MLSLLLRVQGLGPHSLTSQCMTGEYWTGRHWCKCCPAGEYVQETCRSPHTHGTCVKCDRETFTAFPNGLDSCLLCATCSQDQEVMEECTLTSDRMCQCKTGHSYQVPDFYESCRPCSTCPKGNVILQKCNSTADTVCGVPDPGNRSRQVFWIVISVILIISVITICCYNKKKCKSFRAVCHRLQNGNGDGRGSTLLENSVPLTALNGDGDGDPSGPTTGSVSPCEDSLDVESEVQTFTRTPESPAGADGTQAVAATSEAIDYRELQSPSDGEPPHSRTRRQERAENRPPLLGQAGSGEMDELIVDSKFETRLN